TIDAFSYPPKIETAISRIAFYRKNLDARYLFRKSEGVQPFFFKKIRLKFDKLLNPDCSAISATLWVVSISLRLACPSRISFCVSTKLLPFRNFRKRLTETAVIQTILLTYPKVTSLVSFS